MQSSQEMKQVQRFACWLHYTLFFSLQEVPYIFFFSVCHPLRFAWQVKQMEHWFMGPLHCRGDAVMAVLNCFLVGRYQQRLLLFICVCSERLSFAHAGRQVPIFSYFSQHTPNF